MAYESLWSMSKRHHHRKTARRNKRCRCKVEKSYFVTRRGSGSNVYLRIQADCPHRRVLADLGNVRTLDPQTVRGAMERYHTVVPTRLRARSAADTPSDDELDVLDPVRNYTTAGGRRKKRLPNLSETEGGNIKPGCPPLWNPDEPVGGGGLEMTFDRVIKERVEREWALRQSAIDKACRRLLKKMFRDE
jgi:hypothetical protein